MIEFWKVILRRHFWLKRPRRRWIDLDGIDCITAGKGMHGIGNLN